MNEHLTRLQEQGAGLLDRFLAAKNFRLDRKTSDNDSTIAKQVDRLFQDVMSMKPDEQRDRLMHLEPGLAEPSRMYLADVVLIVGRLLYMIKRIRIPMVGWLVTEARNAAFDAMRADSLVVEFDAEIYETPENAVRRRTENTYNNPAVAELLQEITYRLGTPARLTKAALDGSISPSLRAKLEAKAEREQRKCEFVMRVCFLRLQGYTQHEIADELEVKRDPVRTALDHIEKTLADLRGTGPRHEVAL